MEPTMDELANILKLRNLRLSHQRLKVMEYLMKNPIHPCVDRIYTDLHRDIPTLSKTTIYQTLKSLQAAGLIRALNFDDHDTRYEIDAENHGHLKCDRCKGIYDFGIDIDSLAVNLDGFQINDRKAYFKGVCPRCLSNTK